MRFRFLKTVLFITALFFPAYNDKVFLYLQPVLFGELAIMLYLLIKGVKIPTDEFHSSVGEGAAFPGKLTASPTGTR